MRQISRHGQDRRYHHIRVGVNSRLDTIQAAVLLPKLAVLSSEIAIRQQVAHRYAELLRDNPRRTTPFVEDYNISAWAQYSICVDNREKLQQELQLQGFPASYNPYEHMENIRFGVHFGQHNTVIDHYINNIKQAYKLE